MRSLEAAAAAAAHSTWI